MACPNINDPRWQELVGKIGIYDAFKEFVRHGEQIPDPNNYQATLSGVSYSLQIVNALLQPPVEGWFERFYKAEKRPEVFFRKLLQTRAPREQIDLLRDWLEGNTAPTLNDVIAGLISEMAFTVSVNISMTRGLGGFRVAEMTVEEFDALPVQSVTIDEGDEFLDIKRETKVHEGVEYYVHTVEGDREKRVKIDNEPVPSQTYQFLSVPGGTNYREVEIRTPQIEPARYGHGDFSTRHGIGWFRGDEVLAETSRTRADELEEQKRIAIQQGEADETQTGGSWGRERASLEGTRTRRILEIQSDLFQKERTSKSLVGAVYSIEESEGKFDLYIGRESQAYREVYSTYDTREQAEAAALKIIQPDYQQNEFLQVLNRDNNWVKFFIRSIIQDSARKGYEKARFPTGITSSKIQHHTSVEHFTQEREGRIQGLEQELVRLEKMLAEFDEEKTRSFSDQYGRYFSTEDGKYYMEQVDGDETTTEITKSHFDDQLKEVKRLLQGSISDAQREKDAFERELADLRGPEGMGAFSQIHRFYEQTIHNILRKQGFNPQRIRDEYGNEWFEVNVDPKKATSPILLQQDSTTIPGRASQETLDRIREFLDRAGVDVRVVEGILMNGRRIGINGVTRALEGLVVVVNGKEDIALPEEAMHVAVEIVKQTNPSLFKEMMNSIGSYNIFSEIVAEYRNIPFYKNADGSPNIPMLKEEAIAKVLTRVLLDQADEVNERPDFLARTMTWWQKILDWLKVLFGRTQMNPFESLASDILTGKDIGTVGDLREPSGTFAQAGGTLYDQLNNVHANVAKTEDGYELDGTKIRRTIMGEVENFYSRRLRKRTLSDVAQANQEFREETEGNAKQDIQSILDRYIDDNGALRDTPLDQTVPSAIDPYNSTFYNTLEAAIAERLTDYPAGTRFLKDLNVFDDKTNIAGTIDLLAILPDEKVDILQFKVPGLTGLRRDIPTWVQEAYNIEIEGLRRILQNGYGVPRNMFRLTRALPMRANYEYNILGEPRSGLKVSTITIGGLNATIVEDDVLLPVPSLSETTGEEQFDRFISRLRGLVRKLADERVPPDKRLEKGQRIAQLVAAIRKLQVQKKAEDIISSGRTIIRRQQEKFRKLQEKIEQTDPAQASISELNDIADAIMDEKDQVELYADMNKVFREIYTDDSESSKKYIEDARKVSDDAQDMLNRYWKMAVEFRKQKMAAKMGIRDEFTPEKQLSWYRRMIRSLSQSSTKAGAILWGLVKNISNRVDLDFQTRLSRLKEIEEGVDNWLKGRSVKELYRHVLQVDKDGKWNGKFIQRYSRDFYTSLREAQEKTDLKWVMDNIDVDAYKEWYLEEHKRLVENAKTTRVHEDDEENKRRIIQSLQDFINTYSISTSRGVNRNNYRLKDFPKPGKWESDEYNALQKPENKALLDLYNYWVDKLEESLDSGMIDEHNGWSWFPNVRRNLLEKLTTAPGKGKLGSIFGGLRIEKEDTAFGKIDPLTGKPVDEIHASFVSDLGEWVEGADGKYFLDYSEKSMDIFKVMALWEREIVKYKLKTESEGIARLLHYTEENRTAYKTRRTGGIDRDEAGYPIVIDNDINARYIKEHIDTVYYNKNLSDESDIAFELPYKAAVQRINKIFGRKILDEPEQDTITISGVKALNALNRFYVAKTLGLNVFTSLSNLFGGTVNTYINQGRYFGKKDILESELELVSGRFYGPLKNQKQAGLLAMLHPYTDNVTAKDIRNRSVSWAVKWLSSDHLFFMQRGSETAVNSVIAMSHIKNAAVIDGKILNIREYLRKELGYDAKYTGTYEQAEQFERDLDKRVEEMKESPQALLNYAQIVDDEIVIPGISEDAQTLVDFRHLMLQTSRDALGNTSREDLSLYKRSIMWQSFFMFKNWIPRMLDVRAQSLKYNPGSQRYEWGRIRMLGDALRKGALSNISNLRHYFSGSAEPLVDIAKRAYKQKQREFAEQEDRLEMSEAEFVDMYIKGVRSETKELLLALSLMGILVAVRSAEPDEGDPEVRGMYKWMLRGLDKLQDEVSFFYNPISFTNIVNGSVFPAVHLLVELERFIGTGILKAWYSMLGDKESEQYAEDLKPSKYLFRMLPITKELLTYLAIFNEDIAREYNIKIQSRYGVFR
jgi:hypothetical protein